MGEKRGEKKVHVVRVPAHPHSVRGIGGEESQKRGKQAGKDARRKKQRPEHSEGQFLKGHSWGTDEERVGIKTRGSRKDGLEQSHNEKQRSPIEVNRPPRGRAGW